MPRFIDDLIWSANTRSHWLRLWPSTFDFPFANSDTLIGLDIGLKRITLVELAQTNTHYELRRLGLKRLKYRNDTLTPSDYEDMIALTIKELVEACGLTKKNVAVSLSGPSVLIKPLSIPIAPGSNLAIDEYLQWEYQQYADDSGSGDLVWDYYQLPSSPDPPESPQNTPLLLVAARKEVVEEREHLLISAGLSPKILDVDSFALVNMFLVAGSLEQPTVMLVNLGTKVISLAVISNGSGVFMRETSSGILQHEETFQEHSGCSQEEMEDFLFQQPTSKFEENLLKALHVQVASEIRRAMAHVLEATPHTPIQSISLYGEYAEVWNLTNFLQQSVNLPVEIGNPFKGMKIRASPENRQILHAASPLAAIAVGLATRKNGDR